MAGIAAEPACREVGGFHAKKFFELRGITPDIFDGIVFGTTIPQKMLVL
jgi:hypothetical protein